MVHIKTWRIGLPSLRDVFPMFLEAGAQLRRRSETRGIARRHSHIDRRQCMLVQPKGFASQAFDAIACHGCAEGASRNRQPQPRMTFIIGQNRQTEKRVAQSLAALPKGTKFGRLMQSLARLERQPLGQCRRSLESPDLKRQGQSSLRPFARRRASNARPLLVAMRARKPCVRARCKLLGLKVRFIALLLEN
jgi:hypothetical protein